MSASMRHLVVLLFVFSWLAAGCGSPKKVDLGGECLLNSDCNSPLSCSFGKCHTACVQTRDCPLGQSCVMTPGGGVCQLPAEALCDERGACATGLLCAVDNHCRAICASDANCSAEQRCVDGVCADIGDLGPGGSLVPATPSADSGVDAVLCPTGAEICPCYPNDTCNAGLVCASDLCVRLGGAGGASGTGGAGGVGGERGTRGAGSYGIPSQSCSGMTGTECNGESCCTSIPVPGGTFLMGRGTETCSNCTSGCPGGTSCNADETPEHTASVSAFSLDKYEVTVGRFRKFVDAFDALASPPPLDSGAHANLPGTGWQNAWSASLPADGTALRRNLSCNSTYQTWDKANDQLPINCVSWYEALAFCIWDGGRLPTEAEWEYAAAGGSENRIYPWGSSPAPSCSLANYSGCVGKVAPVGSCPSGKGAWGQMDLAGNLWEWIYDWYLDTWYSSTSAGGTDPVNTTPGTDRAARGGNWSYSAAVELRAASRNYVLNGPSARYETGGFRCARNP